MEFKPFPIERGDAVTGQKSRGSIIAELTQILPQDRDVLIAVCNAKSPDIDATSDHARGVDQHIPQRNE